MKWLDRLCLTLCKYNVTRYKFKLKFLPEDLVYTVQEKNGSTVIYLGRVEAIAIYKNSFNILFYTDNPVVYKKEINYVYKNIVTAILNKYDTCVIDDINNANIVDIEEVKPMMRLDNDFYKKLDLKNKIKDLHKNKISYSVGNTKKYTHTGIMISKRDNKIVFNHILV